MKFLILPVTLFCFLTIITANPIDTEQQEYGDKYQGDIILTDTQKSDQEGRNGRTGLLNTNARWQKSNGRVWVYYTIDGVYTTSERNLILKAMAEIQSKTCVTFVQRTTQSDYIRIFSGDGCWSYIGRIGGRQDLSLRRNGCMVHGIAMHELIHALGYGHMHQAYDRDSKVYIYMENIQDSMKQWFDKLDPTYWNNYGTSYDVSSVMHYGPYAFSKNGKMTMWAYNSYDRSVMGQRSYLSSGDITRIKNMYYC